jgi:hypothetical protein
MVLRNVPYCRVLCSKPFSGLTIELLCSLTMASPENRIYWPIYNHFRSLQRIFEAHNTVQTIHYRMVSVACVLGVI